MEKKELISVIVPIYNMEEYLDDCIQSLIHQTYQPLEIILVDDGSSDNSGKMCDYYAGKYDNIKAFHKENKGVSSARNYGISIAKGKYIGFIDPDDYVDVHMYEILYSLLKKYEVSVACARYDLVGEDPGYKLPVDNGKDELVSAHDLIKTQILGIDCLDRFCTYSVWDKLYSKDVIKDSWFPEKVHYAEDALFNIEVILKANNVAYINKTLYHYRIIRKKNERIIEKKIKDKIHSEEIQKKVLIDSEMEDLVKLKKMKIYDDLVRIYLFKACPNINSFILETIRDNKVSCREMMRSDYSVSRRFKLLTIRLLFEFFAHFICKSSENVKNTAK
ncbi:Glycosyltransferase involved in cell wall bisynthesis [Oribacterium sp. KHPX15]|uniref:glycosyltransferase n=1 Tax=Oribacterium sp. KHPX15 TaxID=1855342 RepID=UPI000895E342|nr:glycosyltransferase [Oribacterium sp. KHPX15]SEA56528.1 Glycosyltransferase involved in cell wall bisynthesis [Oribacterium sp. KHPX15]